MLTEFIRYLSAERRYSPLTVRNYKHDVEQFLAWLDCDESRFDPRSVTTEQIREWIIFRTEEGKLSAGSMNREVASLRAFFRWLHRTGAVEKDIFRMISTLKTSRRLPAFVPESRMTTIVSECGPDSEDFQTERNSLIILMFYACGLRLAELVGIDRSDFSADYTSLRVRGKGDKQRMVPILEFLREKILHYLGLMLKRYNGITGLKTGTTSGAGVCISASATRDGLDLIAVVLGSLSSSERFTAATTLLDYGFAAYAAVPLPAMEDRPLLIKVKGSAEESVPLDYTALPETLLMPKENAAALTAQLDLPQELEAPVQLGQTVGTVRILSGETQLGEYEVRAAADAEKMDFGTAFGLLWDALTGCES